MHEFENALPQEGLGKCAQNSGKYGDALPRDRRFLLFTALFCVLMADTLLWHGPTASLTVLTAVWFCLLLAYLGPAGLAARSGQVLLFFCLFLALTFALGSNWYFRVWNYLALLALLPVQAIGLSGAAQLPWYRPAMLWERLCLLLWGMLGHAGAAFSVLSAGKTSAGRRTGALVLGLAGAGILVAILLPVLASADALFAAATAELRAWAAAHFSTALWKIAVGLLLTPFFFGFLYLLRHPVPLKYGLKSTRAGDALVPAVILAALDLLYLLFLSVQSAGLFGGPAYLAARGLSYADWARSGFFQMAGVTALNLTVLLAALTFPRRDGRAWRMTRLLAGALVAESCVLLASAAWRMTLYVSAYGLSFKRLMTYWGMGMMALFFLAALGKVLRPDLRFCRIAFPLALAGWLVINCVPADYLVARNQVDRYLNGESPSIDAEYLLYGLSYDTLSQLDRLDGSLICRDTATGGQARLDTLIQRRRAEARAECADWHTWSLSACLAAMEGG